MNTKLCYAISQCFQGEFEVQFCYVITQCLQRVWGNSLLATCMMFSEREGVLGRSLLGHDSVFRERVNQCCGEQVREGLLGERLSCGDSGTNCSAPCVCLLSFITICHRRDALPRLRPPAPAYQTCRCLSLPSLSRTPHLFPATFVC